MLNVSDLGEKIRSLVRRMMQLERWHAFGIVVDYNPTTHKVIVTLMPDGAVTPPIPLMVPWLGALQAPQKGMQCKVLIDRDRADSVIGFGYSGTDYLPSVGISVEGDSFIGGTLTVAHGLLMTPLFELPPIGLFNRGEMVVYRQTPGAQAGPADGLYIALQNAAGAMVWWYAGGP